MHKYRYSHYQLIEYLYNTIFCRQDNFMPNGFLIEPGPGAGANSYKKMIAKENT